MKIGKMDDGEWHVHETKGDLGHRRMSRRLVVSAAASVGCCRAPVLACPDRC